MKMNKHFEIQETADDRMPGEIPLEEMQELLKNTKDKILSFEARHVSSYNMHRAEYNTEEAEWTIYGRV